MPKLSKSLSAALAGQAGEATYVDDVFSTYLYTGNGSTQTITNGIDLDGEGGMVWVKNRDTTDWHYLSDTERGLNQRITTNWTSGNALDYNSVTSFNTNGFSVGYAPEFNRSGSSISSWTFRKAPGFFDVVTYTGVDQGTPRRISHNLGCKPGMIIVKRTDDTSDWYVWHKSLSSNTHDRYLKLQDTGAESYSADFWGTSDPTSTDFGVKTFNNITGGTYVAYLFADGDDADAQIFGTDGDQAVVKCGSYTGTGGDLSIDCGFEPQFVIIKNSTNAYNWQMHDNMRGVSTGGNDTRLHPNLSNAESTDADWLDFNATGFTVHGATGGNLGASGHGYIYIAIRRPHKPAESGTEVFDVNTYTGNATPNTNVTGTTGVLSDFVMLSDRDATSTGWSSYAHIFMSRLMGGSTLSSASTNSQVNGWEGYYAWDGSTSCGGWGLYGGSSNTAYLNKSGNDYVAYRFQRSPGFFDVVCYAGSTTTPRTISHNLGVAPEMIWIKGRDAGGGQWYVYHAGMGNQAYGRIDGTDRFYTSSDGVVAQTIWNATDPTESVFSLGNASNGNSNGQNFIAYLFASQDGISKVGSYTGTGSDGNNIDCGFTNGARFVLIKRTDATDNWMVFDTERGIVAGNDPFLRLDTTNAEITGFDLIDPYSSGFSVNNNVTVNASGGTYIYLAIA